MQTKSPMKEEKSKESTKDVENMHWMYRKKDCVGFQRGQRGVLLVIHAEGR